MPDHYSFQPKAILDSLPLRFIKNWHFAKITTTAVIIGINDITGFDGLHGIIKGDGVTEGHI